MILEVEQLGFRWFGNQSGGFKSKSAGEELDCGEAGITLRGLNAVEGVDVQFRRGAELWLREPFLLPERQNPKR